MSAQSVANLEWWESKAEQYKSAGVEVPADVNEKIQENRQKAYEYVEAMLEGGFTPQSDRSQKIADDIKGGNKSYTGGSMSGETHTTTGADPAQVQDQIDRTRVEQGKDTDRKIKESEQKQRQDLNNRLKPIEDKNQQHDKAIKDQGKSIDVLKTDIKDVETRLTKTIGENRKHLLDELDKSEKRQNKKVDALRDDVGQKLKDQREEYQELDRKQTQRLEKERVDRITAQNRINSRIDEVDDRLDDTEATLKDQRSEYTSLIASQRQQFNQKLTQERQVREEQLASITTQMETMQSSQDAQQRFAKDLFQDVKKVLMAAESTYEHDRFAPGKIKELKQQLQGCAALAANGMWQSVAAVTQSVYSELCDLRLTLSHLKDEWVLRKAAAIESLDKALIQAEGYRRSTLTMSIEQGEAKCEFDVDRWTKGDLSEFEALAKSLKTQVENNALTPDVMIQVEQKLVTLPEMLEAIVSKGKAALIASQHRVQMGSQVVEGLARCGYRLVDEENDAVFEGNDDRNAFVVKLRNGADDSIVAVIAPQEGDVNLLSLNTFSQTLVDEESSRQNGEAVAEALQEIGIQVGEMKCEQSPNESYRDLEVVKSRQVQPHQPQQTGAV